MSALSYAKTFECDSDGLQVEVALPTGPLAGVSNSPRPDGWSVQEVIVEVPETVPNMGIKMTARAVDLCPACQQLPVAEVVKRVRAKFGA